MEDYNIPIKEYKYSIIIPHKNSFSLLLHLLDTIPVSTDFQVIVVDDNSKKEEIIQLKNHSYAPNVTVYYNPEGGGAGKARNIGLKYAKGKWLLFADADDYFTASIKELLDVYYHSDNDIIYFGCSSIYIDTGKIAYRHERNMSLINGFLNNPTKEKEEKLKYYYTGPIAKMIRTSIVKNNNIKFREVITANDMYFSLKTAFYANKITACKEVLYIISVSQGSLTTTVSKEYFNTRFLETLWVNDYLRKINKKKYQQSVLYFIAKSYQFGLPYILYVLRKIIEHRSNLLIGIRKIFSFKAVLKDRENPQYTLKKN